MGNQKYINENRVKIEKGWNLLQKNLWKEDSQDLSGQSTRS